MHYIPVPPPPQTTAISMDFKKSTAMCKVHNVGLRYIKVTRYPNTDHDNYEHTVFSHQKARFFCLCIQYLLSQTEVAMPLKKKKEAISIYAQHLHIFAIIFTIYITCSLYLTSI